MTETNPPKVNAEPDVLTDLSKLPMEEPEEGVFTAYANVVNVDWTLDDVRVRFAEMTQVPGEEDPTWKGQHTILLERAIITLSWRQAKNLAVLLGSVVLSYESVNGEIRQPKLAPPPPSGPLTP